MLQYSNYSAFAYLSSAFKILSEAFAGLEAEVKAHGATPPPGNVTMFDWIPCIPGFPCRMPVANLQSLLDAVKDQVDTQYIAACDMIHQAHVTDFEMRISELPGPAPNRPGGSPNP